MGMILNKRTAPGRPRRGWRRPRYGPVALVATVAAALGAAGCSSGGSAGGPDAVAAFFPLAAAVTELAGSDLTVMDLTPPGVEPHDLEVTPDIVDSVLDARVAVLMGGGFQPAVEEAAARRDGPTITVMDRLNVGDDPHVWLDPILMRRLVRSIAPDLARDAKVPLSAVSPRQRRLTDRLTALDLEYRRGLADCDRRVIVTAHDAFGRLVERYRLRAEPIAGISPESEPDPARLGVLADLVEREGVTTVFTEELVSPRVARTLAREAKVETAVLDTLETAPAGSDIDHYFSVMRTNLRTIQQALGCRAA